jgi:hypothetical protein
MIFIFLMEMPVVAPSPANRITVLRQPENPAFVSVFLSPSMQTRVNASGVPAPRRWVFEAWLVLEGIAGQSLELPNPIH